jgi:hypothetical protein
MFAVWLPHRSKRRIGHEPPLALQYHPSNFGRTETRP